MAKPPKKEEEKPAAAETGADGEGAAVEGFDDDGKKGKKKKIIIIAVAAILLLGGAGTGLYFTGMLDSLLGKKPAETCVKDEHGVKTCTPAPAEADGGHDGGEAKDGEHGAEGATVGTQFLKIPDMIVNLNSDDGTPRYLRLSVQLEFKNAADMAAVEKVMPRVVDQFQTYLRELRVKDLKGSAGIYRLQMELLARVNQAAFPVEVQDVLFQEILVQ